MEIRASTFWRPTRDRYFINKRQTKSPYAAPCFLPLLHLCRPIQQTGQKHFEGGISRLYGVKGVLRRKKYKAFTHPLSGTVSDGEAAYSTVRSLSSSHPKSPLKTGLQFWTLLLILRIVVYTRNLFFTTLDSSDSILNS